MNARKKLLDFLASNPDMLTPQQSQRVEALRESTGPAKVVAAVPTGSLPAWMAHELIIAWENRMLKLETDRQRARVVNDYKKFSELTDKRDELLQCINDLRQKMERTDWSGRNVALNVPHSVSAEQRQCADERHERRNKMNACKTEDDCPTPMWCRGKSECARVTSALAPSETAGVDGNSVSPCCAPVSAADQSRG